MTIKGNPDLAVRLLRVGIAAYTESMGLAKAIALDQLAFAANKRPASLRKYESGHNPIPIGVAELLVKKILSAESNDRLRLGVPLAKDWALAFLESVQHSEPLTFLETIASTWTRSRTLSSTPPPVEIWKLDVALLSRPHIVNQVSEAMRQGAITMITGMRGIGKTTSVKQAWNEHFESGAGRGYQNPVWINCRSKSIDQDFLSFLASEICRQVQRPIPVGTPIDMFPRLASERLATEKSLIVIDDVEEDELEQIGAFLQSLPATCSTILTLPRPIGASEIERELPVPEFTAEEVKSYVELLKSKLQISVDERELAEIDKLRPRHPFLIKNYLVVGRHQGKRRSSPVPSAPSSDNEIVDIVRRQAFRQLVSQECKQLFALVAKFQSPIRVPHLCEMLNAKPDVVDRLVGEACDWDLATVSQGFGHDSQQIQGTSWGQELFAAVDDRALEVCKLKAEAIWLAWCRKLADSSSDAWIESGSLRLFSEYMKDIQAVAEHWLKFKSSQGDMNAFAFCRSASYGYWSVGKGFQTRDFSEAWLDAARRIGTEEAIVEALAFNVTLRVRQIEYVKMEDKVRELRNRLDSIKNPYLRLAALHADALARFAAGKVSDAESIWSTVTIDDCIAAGYERQWPTCRSWLALCLVENKRLDDAKLVLQDALDWCSERRATRNIIVIKSKLATVQRMLGNLNVARSLALDSLRLSLELPYYWAVAETNVVLALVEKATRNYSATQTRLQEAFEQYERMGGIPRIGLAHEEREEIHAYLESRTGPKNLATRPNQMFGVEEGDTTKRSWTK